MYYIWLSAPFLPNKRNKLPTIVRIHTRRYVYARVRIIGAFTQVFTIRRIKKTTIIIIKIGTLMESGNSCIITSTYVHDIP